MLLSQSITTQRGLTETSLRHQGGYFQTLTHFNIAHLVLPSDMNLAPTHSDSGPQSGLNKTADQLSEREYHPLVVVV